MAKIAFFGLGRMGGPMASNLIRAGHNVTSIRRGIEKSLSDFERLGGTLVDNVAEALEDTKFIILMVQGSEQVEELINSVGGILESVKAGTVIIDCSTSIAESTKYLHEQFEQRGAHLVDAPVVRGVAGARNGTLAFFIGGEEAAISAAMPILEVLGNAYFPVGGPGAGHTVKALNNLLSLGHLALLSEAIELARVHGVDFEQFCNALKSGNARSATLEQHAERINSDDLEDVRFAIDLAAKDLAIANAMAVSAGLETAPSNGILEIYCKAQRESLGSQDITSIRQVFR